MRKIIVIGGGIAGLSAAQAAREKDAGARIHLVCGEKRLPYYRTRLTELLSGLGADKLYVRNYQWFMDNRVEVINGRAISVDAEENKLRFDDGSFLFYDDLVLAAGATAYLPEMKGNAAKNALTLRFWADIERIESIPGPVVVVGGGLLGIEAAWQLSRMGRPVTVIERGPRLLGNQLDEEASHFFLGVTENAGVRVALNGQVESYQDSGLLLTDGRFFEAAVLLFCVGINPQIKLAKSAGLAANRGIVVDEYMRTNQPNIFACGDCAEFNKHIAGRWTAAIAQGMVAGANAAGAAEIYLPETAPYMLTAMGSQLWAAGTQTANSLCVKSSSDGKLIKLFFDDKQQMCGGILIGDTNKALMLKKAVQDGMSKEEANQKLLN